MNIDLNVGEGLKCHEAALEKYTRAGGILGRTPRYNSSMSFHEQIAELAESLGAEWAVAKYFAINYDPNKDTYKTQADVGAGLEIKWSKYSNGHLIIYPTDRVSDIGILVTGKFPTYTIIGWIPVAMAKKDRYKHSAQDSWWVDQGNLQPIQNLVRSSYADATLQVPNL
ncbi:hypothetical protein UFOVP1665_6 [uncultured Caudovirales phage]|uniref:Uncharacterized protein n=1 Tax=uncultured Caudovirales phage TaxID=2100421 RepID=A0A6J5T7P9_9CAUD|nr:hypothetical protein UFOVP1665_6 [uncultured Caudovirales phage]